MSAKPSKYGSISGSSGPFKVSTSSSMSKKLKEPKKKRGDTKREEENTSKRRTQNRDSQRAYRERREQRLMELESQVQEAENLNQTLSSAYQNLKSELDQLESEKSQEQYFEGFSAQPGFTSDSAYAASSSTMTGYEQVDTTWADSSYASPDWQGGDSYNYQG